MGDAARANLARRQEELLAALVGTGPAPAGFDGTRVRLAGEGLLRKRRRGVAKTWPRMVGEMGERFGEVFDCYAGEHPHPPEGGPIADGWRLAAWLEERGALSEAGRIEFASMRLRLRWVGDRLERRSGPRMVVAVLQEARRVVIGLAWWGEGAVWVRVPVPGIALACRAKRAHRGPGFVGPLDARTTRENMVASSSRRLGGA